MLDNFSRVRDKLVNAGYSNLVGVKKKKSKALQFQSFPVSKSKNSNAKSISADSSGLIKNNELVCLRLL